MIGGAPISGSPLGALAADRQIITFQVPRREYFTALITGIADGLSDLTIPISSLSVRLRSGDPTFVSVVIPGVSYASAISARPSGRLRVTYSAVYPDGSSNSLAFAESLIEEIRIDQGATNQSLTVYGHLNTANDAATTIALSGINYYAMESGKKVYRSRFDPNLRAGDTATYGADSFVIDSVTLSASTSIMACEVRE